MNDLYVIVLLMGLLVPVGLARGAEEQRPGALEDVGTDRQARPGGIESMAPLDMGEAVGRIMSSLAFIVAAIILCVVVVRWMSRVKPMGAKGERELHLMERLTLGPKRHLFLVAWGPKRLVLSSSDRGIMLLASSDVCGSDEGPNSEARSFDDGLRQAGETMSVTERGEDA